MFISSLYNILQEKDEKIEEPQKDENLADKEETPEKNQDKKKPKEDDENDDDLFKDIDDEHEEISDEKNIAKDNTDVPDGDNVDNSVGELDNIDDGLDDLDTSTDDTNSDTPEEGEGEGTDNTDMTDDGTDNGDDLETEPEIPSDPEFIKVKNLNKRKKLLKEYIELYEFYGKLIYKIDALKNLSPEEMRNVDACLLRLNNTKKMLFDYIQTMYNIDSYERALSMYFNFKIPINFTEEIITKIAEKRNNT